MRNKINILKIIVIFIFIFRISLIFAATHSSTCLDVNGLPDGQSLLIESEETATGEYVIYINGSHTITDNVKFIKKNIPSCNNKKLILEIRQGITLELKDVKTVLNIGGDLDLIRLVSTENTIPSIIFKVNNDEENQTLYNDPKPGTFEIEIPIEVSSNYKIKGEEKDRKFINKLDNIDAPKRAGYGVSLKFKEIIIRPDIDLNIEIIANDRQDSDIEKAENKTMHGMHGGISELFIDSLINYGNLDLKLKAGNGSNGVNAKKHKAIKGGEGGKGGLCIFDINTITNYKDISIEINSGDGGNGGIGSGQGWLAGIGAPKSGGDGGNSGDLNYSIKNIKNQNNSKLNIYLNTGKGGEGGDSGNDRFAENNDIQGGHGGKSGDILIKPITEIVNHGILDFDIKGGNGGKGGLYIYREKPKSNKEKTGKSGSGGSISDLNFINLENYNDLKINLKSGKINVNSTANTNNYNRGTATTGSIGSINIDLLLNKTPYFEITSNLNEQDVKNLNSSMCSCIGSGECLGENYIDPTIGDVVVNYLVSGSYLPNKIRLLKNASYLSTPSIKINSCYLYSSGNSQNEYVADVLDLKISNLSDIANDFNNTKSQIRKLELETIFCPVCDSLELDNPLRIDEEFVIYSTNNQKIIDLNIYYLDNNNNFYSPPGYPTNKEYIVYSLNDSEIIEPSNSLIFGENIKEYKISKEKLYYNLKNINLNELEDADNVLGITTNQIKLFCPAQKYQIKYKLENGTSKTINFTPLFNIR